MDEHYARFLLFAVGISLAIYLLTELVRGAQRHAEAYRLRVLVALTWGEERATLDLWHEMQGSLGGLYVALEELERRGLVRSRRAEGGFVRNYRPKLLWTLTEKGQLFGAGMEREAIR